MSDDAENELREIRAKMERGELQDPTTSLADQVRQAFLRIERRIREFERDIGMPLGWGGIVPIEPEEDETADDGAWADFLIWEAGCKSPETEG